jgi:class 3 adenylate cyclase/putative methionine-R-sulfoxide reductase with GAF domain
MVNLTKQHIDRGVGRREEDMLVRYHNQQYKELYNMGQTLTSEMDMAVLFEKIANQTNEIMGTERSSVFLFDDQTNELWSLIATGMERNEIRIPADSGVAGSVFESKTPVIINDTYSDVRFNPEIDKMSGFKTRNILCIPLINKKGECIGVLQTLNKKLEVFSDHDQESITSISHYVGIALENSKLYKDVKDYSEELKATLLRIETLEKVKSNLTKYVPISVAKMAEEDPDKLTLEKVPMDVTILFLDIQGFSKITEGHDTRQVNDMVETHFSSYLDCIRRHTGEVNETTGDGLMVIFKDGPIETNAKAAVSAGLEIVSENARLNEKLSYPWGSVNLHMGISSGEAYVGSTKMKSVTGERWTYTASGLVTVMAARVGALSEDTKIYIGYETYQHVKDSFKSEFQGNKKLKNIKDPIPVYWVKGTNSK